MSDPWGESWSDNPNAPRIPYLLYVDEKSYFAGFLVGAILYGVVVALFFQCMNVLLNPVNPTAWGTKWGLVAHTVVTFSFVTIYSAMYLDVQSLSYIDNREFPGNDVIPPGPIGYQFHILQEGISIVPTAVTIMNNWLADGLLLYRYSVIYAMNYWAIAFPGLMYIASFAMGIAFIYQSSQPVSSLSSYTTISNFGISFYTITASLNVTLTLMIITKLMVHRKNVRKSMGGPAGASAGRTYTSVIVMFIESYALYTVTFLVFVALWVAKTPVANAFYPMLVQTQAIAPFLITLRVASREAVKDKTAIYGSDSSIRFSSHGMVTGVNETLSDGYPMTPRDGHIQEPVEVGVAM